MDRLVGWLLGLNDVQSIERIEPALAAPWAVANPFWACFGVVLIFVLTLAFYLRGQDRGSFAARFVLGAVRAVLLTLLLVTLADPVLQVSLVEQQRPLVYLVFDGTDSMAIRDQYPEDQRRALEAAIGDVDRGTAASRVECLRGLLARENDNLIQRLTANGRVRLECFVFEGNTTSRLRKLDMEDAASESAGRRLAAQLTTDGQVTALGAVLRDIRRQSGSGALSAVVLFSDFAQNSGSAPVGDTGGASSATQLGVPIYTVGVGATEATDLAVDLQTDPKMKKAERSSVLVRLRQSGLQNQDATVTLTSRKLSGEVGGSRSGETVIGRKIVALTSPLETVDFPYTPDDAGRFVFAVTAEPLGGEALLENNRAAREVNIIDDFLRLMYVAYEPSWEWRFIKEVFHRDKLVGLDGFRTYLASSDPNVRASNNLFLPNLTPERSEFFATDVIFLDDMPRDAINDRFCDLVKEFVGRFGGGLVVIAGPRFGPGDLESTALADILPVIVDPNAPLRDEREFRLRFTPHASRYPFLQLGADPAENVRAWNNLQLLPWYRGVAQLRPQSYALAEHPTDTCHDGTTPQPLIAIRQYGAGEVVYLGFNETWRMRRLYGERYYRQFWSQLIYRLGMSHALGSEKRFVVRTDRQQYRVEDKVTLTVEAYDQDYEPLGDGGLPVQSLAAELTAPGADGLPHPARDLAVPLLRQGIFEAQIPVYHAGQYSIRVQDPVTAEYSEVRFDVTELSAERRNAVRNENLQTTLAAEARGKSYDLATAGRLVDDLHTEPLVERYTRSQPLWSTPLWFIALVGLMLGEWSWRKMIRLA